MLNKRPSLYSQLNGSTVRWYCSILSNDSGAQFSFPLGLYTGLRYFFKILHTLFISKDKKISSYLFYKHNSRRRYSQIPDFCSFSSRYTSFINTAMNCLRLVNLRSKNVIRFLCQSQKGVLYYEFINKNKNVGIPVLGQLVMNTTEWP